MNFTKSRTAITTALVAGALFFSASIFAQSGPADGELKKFAGAFSEISQIHHNFQGKLQQESDPEQQQQLQHEANQKMVQAIQQNDLSVDRYNEIVTLLQNDESLQNRLGNYLDQ